ncbi:MAG: NAD-dependent epimerase/dehydratase family protein [Sandaracinaceae bacterium]|nr:NAD-dependent epimerase/dehydratase family protein [Sandaracinaceae bacterium]
MRVFVTGGSGFVGGHAIEGLTAAGHEVFAMARSDASAAKVRGYGAKPVTCSLGAVRPEHLEGVDAVVHCAAFVEEWGTRAQFWEANVEGTTQLLSAARDAGVKRFVHIGTEAALFDGHPLVDVDESTPYPARQRFLYSETKAEAERRVLAADADGFSTVSLRPRLVWGPRDTSVLPAVVRMAGSWTWLDGGQARTSTCHVQNLVRAIELALEQGRGGEAYFVADAGETSVREFIGALARTQDVELPDRSLPGGLVRPVARALEGLWRLVGASSPPPVTHFAASMMSRSITVDASKAARELGYAPVISVEEGLASLGNLA